MTPQELKNSILQQAIQGKLVEQRPEEGTAEELFAQIQKEKQKLIAEKKIKKEKPLPEIIDDEKPFDIPESWKWVHIGEIFQHNTGKALNSSSKLGNPYEYITTSNVYWNRFELDQLKTMLFTDVELAKCTVQKGDLLVLEGGDCGRAAIWNFDFSMRIQNHIHRLRPYIEICVEYFYHIFYLYKNSGMINGKGIAIQGLSSNALHSLVVPLPPLAEQKRIVAKIEELLPYIDRYEQAWSKLEQFNSRFPEDMKKSLLQYAIQGKLVEQRPEEGTAEELFAQIQKEKQKLIAEKKIKKEKPLPEITDDEKPFDIPESWKWVRFSELCSVLTCGYASTPTYVDKESGKPFISAKNVKPNKFMPEDHKYISCELYEKLTQNAKPEKGDILLTRVGAGIGEAAIIDIEFDFAIYVSLTLIKLVDINLVNNQFILYWLNSPIGVSSAQKNIYGKNASQGNLNVKNVRDFLVPLPPIAEQKRIVEKLEQILPLCKRLI
jgi:type I restriction enzyme S subunit